MNINLLKNSIKNIRTRGAWNSGVKDYALMLLNSTEFPDGEVTSADDLRSTILNGSANWQEYSENGYALIYDEDIASMLCTPTELKRTKNGKVNPSDTVTWFDLQAKALYEAYLLIVNTLENRRRTVICMQ